jgi:glycosyltransferase involved in cell wall biosynthesis
MMPGCIDARNAFRVVQVSFHADEHERDAESLLRAWPTLLGVAAGVARAGVGVTVVQAASRDQTLSRDGVAFNFVHDPSIVPGAPSRRFTLPRRPRRVIDAVVAARPDVVHVQGLGHAIATRQLMAAIPGVPVLVQDHASSAPRLPRAIAWRWAYRELAGAAFAAREQGEAFVTTGVLPARMPRFEVIEGSTDFTPGDTVSARAASRLTGDPCLLWTGHLDENKDPLTLLAAFRMAVARLPAARLWCCFGKAPLLAPVQRLIAGTPELAPRVTLLGAQPHDRLEELFRSADFFVQMSHREGCSYSTIEALACGATPLVTDLPSSRRIVGDAGSLTPVGDAIAMAEAIVVWAGRDRARLRRAARSRFDDALSYDVIGRDLRAAYEAIRASR